MDTPSPSIQGLLAHSSSIEIDYSDEVEYLGSDNLSEEDEEEGGKAGGPPTLMLCQGVFDSLKN